jgi:hypothetical protein
MADRHEALRRRRRNEVAGDLLERFIAGLERVLTACVAGTQPRLADGVGNIEKMELMGNAGRREQFAAPCTGAGSTAARQSPAAVQRAQDFAGFYARRDSRME